jgi:hypothetical protein
MRLGGRDVWRAIWRIPTSSHPLAGKNAPGNFRGVTAGLQLSSLSALPSDDALRLLAFAQDLSSLREITGVSDVVKRATRDLIGADGVTFVLREGEQVFYADEDTIGPLLEGEAVSR